MNTPRRRPFFVKLSSSVLKRWLRTRHRFQGTHDGRKAQIRCRYFSANFLIDLNDGVSYAIAAKYYEWHEIKLMIDACRRHKPDVFIDIGANIGLYSCILGVQKLVPRILAFEPDLQSFNLLNANLDINGLRTVVQAHAVAVGACEGTAMLLPAGIENRGLSRIDSAAGGGYSVPIVSLDDVADLDGHTIAIKIDVEGYELEVLAGAKLFFGRNRGYAQIEALDNRIAANIIERMVAFGWRLVGHYGINLRFERP